MSVTFGFYNSVNHDRKYNASQISTLFDGIINDGIIASIGDAMEVLSTSGMGITVGTGKAWFDHTWTLNDALLPLTVEPSEAVLNRIDAVVLEKNSTDEVRANSIKIIKGVPGTNPVAPTMTKTTLVSQYPLALIAVGAGVTSISQVNITNKIGTSDCPYVTGLLQIISTDAIVAQWETEFTEWLDYIKSVFVDDPAGHLQSEIEALNLKFENITVPTASFVADTTWSGFGYKSVISCTDVTSDYLARVVFNPTDATSGNYAAVSGTGAGTVTIYAKAVPSIDLVIPTIFCSKAVSQA